MGEQGEITWNGWLGPIRLVSVAHNSMLNYADAAVIPQDKQLLCLDEHTFYPFTLSIKKSLHLNLSDFLITEAFNWRLTLQYHRYFSPMPNVA